MSERLRLMCVHAHPDDESSKGAATMAKYVDAGHEVLVVSCTGGERGSILNPRLAEDIHILRDLVHVRRDEMARAQQILGVQHTWLGFVDSGLPRGRPTAAAARRAASRSSRSRSPPRLSCARSAGSVRTS